MQYGYMVIEFWFMTIIVLKDSLGEYSHMMVKNSDQKNPQFRNQLRDKP